VTDSVSYGAAVKIDMTPDSAGAFRDFTTASVGRQTQLVVDGKVISEPVIREPIMGGSVMISVDTATEAQSLARQLSAPGATITVRLAP
jgi:preprotein translocase subunit SecD